MTDPKRGCLTCRWADYAKTPTGKLKKGFAVKCLFSRPPSWTLEQVLAPLLSSAQIKMLSVSVPTNVLMWPEEGQHGSDCTKWEPKE